MYFQDKGGAPARNPLLTLSDVRLKQMTLMTQAERGMNKAILKTLKFRESRMRCWGLERRAIKESFIVKSDS